MNAEPLEEHVGGPGAGASDLTVALDGDGPCIAEARHLTADYLTRTRAADGPAVTERAVGLAQLVVSELVTNARKYAPGPILVSLGIDGQVLEIEVWDSAPELPAPRAADPRRIGQHGLEIVEAVAERLTVRPETVGKRVTARLRLTEDHQRSDPDGSARKHLFQD
ncbi:ATP-binding protein [Streptomyces sp. J2-1]|uniref:ATP-binding protein n=1 Tax=Streptomyces corallincola TaxID=2851888 RepID=UPI001C38AEB6|nr:ATP-binding protein [Streptomyces corallincola]MBV2356328.1 ATP-binding protein [Streptomyces corallincola]